VNLIRIVRHMSFSERISEARIIAQAPRIAQDEDYFYDHFVRRFSIYLSYLFWKLGVSANALTIIMSAARLMGSVCIVFDKLWLTLLGAFFWHLSFVLDRVDGEVARLGDQSTALGIYLDEMSHVFFSPLGLALGIHVCLKEWSLLNVISTFIVYSVWHWSKHTSCISRLVLGAKYGADVHKVETRGSNKKSVLSLFRFIIVQNFHINGQMYIIPTIIILNHVTKYDITSWFLHLYALFVLIYVGLLVLHDGYGAHRIDVHKSSCKQSK